jgi:hypothetical protein
MKTLSVSDDDAVYRKEFMDAVERGLRDADQNRTYTGQEVRDLLRKNLEIGLNSIFQSKRQ